MPNSKMKPLDGSLKQQAQLYANSAGLYAGMFK